LNQYDHKWESKSIIIPYKKRDHAWSAAEHDATNFYDFRDTAPKGYNEDMTYEEPHPTNIPYKVPEEDPEVCEANATSALKKATTSEEMIKAKEAVDKCVKTLKKQIEEVKDDGEKPKKEGDAKKAPAKKDDKKGDKKKENTPAGASGPKKGDDGDKKKDDGPAKKEDKKPDPAKQAEKAEKKDDKKEDDKAKEGKDQKKAQISARTATIIKAQHNIPDVAKNDTSKVKKVDLTIQVAKPGSANNSTKPASKTNETVKVILNKFDNATKPAMPA
jgi:hypothetical protein